MYEALIRQFRYLERVAPRRLENPTQHESAEVDRTRDQLHRLSER